MKHRDKIVIGASLAALAGVALLLGAIAWLLWRESIAAEEAYARDLARLLGERTERIILDTRDLLAGLDRLALPRCSDAHLQVLQEAAMTRPHVRAIGHWRGAERLCSVGFLQQVALTPPRADRIYPSGVIAWWPGPETEVGGVQLFLMRFGEHDVAIDPRMLLGTDLLQSRQAGLWVEGLRMASMPPDAALPSPETLPVGLTIDHDRNRLISRFSQHAIMPIEVVAIEPVQRFRERHARTLFTGGGVALALVAAWILLVFRYLRRELSLAGELRRALAGGSLSVQYQPVLELGSGRCVGAEALARWVRDNGEPVSPEVFIPLAEAAGLVPQISIAVMRTTLRDLNELLRNTPGLSINLNLGADDLTGNGFSTALEGALLEAGLPATAIKLEITERALVNSNAARQVIHAFRDRGHRLAIDDFGTGYSSLAYLQSFELDELKIDKSFVDAIGTGAATSGVIVHVIEMAQSLGLETVAEGVETVAQAQWLLDRGVRYGQGFLFSKPLSAAGFLDYFQSSRDVVAPLQ